MIYLVTALILTLIIEIPIVIKLLPSVSKNALITSVAVNLLTNPLLNYILLLARTMDKPFNLSQIVFLELIIIFVEALIYYKKLHINIKQALKVSVVANSLAVFCGKTLLEVITYI